MGTYNMDLFSPLPILTFLLIAALIMSQYMPPPKAARAVHPAKKRHKHASSSRTKSSVHKTASKRKRRH
jgi:hypothetical protein